MASQNCLFCDISNGKTATVLEVESDEFVIFKDIFPASQFHYLIVPKKHYDSIKVLNQSHENMVLRMEQIMKCFFESKGINTMDALFGFHIPPFISVSHLHMHGIAPRTTMGSEARQIYKPSTIWFKTSAEAQSYLRQKQI